MKKLSLFILLLSLINSLNAQIKVWPGGTISVGTVTNAPASPDRALFWGPLNIKQSNYAQILLTLDANNQGINSKTLVTNIKNFLTKNYVLRLGVNDVFYVQGKGHIYGRSLYLWSDSTLKTQITTLDSALYKVSQLRGVSYKYKNDISDTSVYGGVNAKKYIGLIAQEVNAVIPEAVDTSDSLMAVNYPNLIGLLIESTKELNNKVNDLWKMDAVGNVYQDSVNVGIGTATPTHSLDAVGTVLLNHSGYQLLLDDSLFGSPTLTGGVIAYNDTANHTFFANGVITADGNSLAVLTANNSTDGIESNVLANSGGAYVSSKNASATSAVEVTPGAANISNRDSLGKLNTSAYASPTEVGLINADEDGGNEKYLRINNDDLQYYDVHHGRVITADSGRVVIGAANKYAKLTVINGDTAAFTNMSGLGPMLWTGGNNAEIGIASISSNKPDTTNNYTIGTLSLVLNEDEAVTYQDNVVGIGMMSTANVTWGYNYGIYGEARSADEVNGYGIGVVGTSYGTGHYNVGGKFTADSYADSTISYGVWGVADAGAGHYAGYFSGDVMTSGAYYTASDPSIKTNIRTYTGNAIAGLNALNISTYEFNGEMRKSHNLPAGQQLGVMANEVEKYWPWLVKNSGHIILNGKKDIDAKGIAANQFKVVNYTGLIPVIIKGMQQLNAKQDSLQAALNTTGVAKVDSLQKVITAMQTENELLKKDVAEIKGMLTKFGDDLQYCCFNQQNNITPNNDKSMLEQNTPNPFNENTTIRYYITQASGNAIIRITNLNGVVVNTFKIQAKGAGQILISGSSLAAGTYVYELIVDGKQIDSKRMVLTY